MQDQPVLLVGLSELRTGELSNSLADKGYVSMHKVAQPTPRHLRRSKLPWIRALVLEAKNSDLMVSIFKKGQNRNKKAIRTEGIIRLLLIILWAIVVVVLGFYSGLAYHHH